MKRATLTAVACLAWAVLGFQIARCWPTRDDSDVKVELLDRAWNAMRLAEANHELLQDHPPRFWTGDTIKCGSETRTIAMCFDNNSLEREVSETPVAPAWFYMLKDDQGRLSPFEHVPEQQVVDMATNGELRFVYEVEAQ